MRYYRIDDLTESAVSDLRAHLGALDMHGGMDGMYWLPVGQKHFSPMQSQHLSTCGPYAMALEVTEGTLQLELLVRARNQLRCECVHYASPELQAHMMHFVDDMLLQLGITV